MRKDAGYSLIEVLVTITIMATLLAIGVGSFRSWALAKDHEGAAVDMQTILRQTQTRAITEGVAFCVHFDTSSSSYTVNRYACGEDGVKINGPFEMNDPRVRLRNAQFRAPDGTLVDEVTFKPTGTATAGGINITRVGSSKVYRVDVEGFTGRVSITS